MPAPLTIDKISGLKPLNLPEFAIKFRNNAGFAEIYDSFRKKFVFLTPEEWVRQNFALYLSETKGFPKSRIKLEKPLLIAGTRRRCDIVYYDKNLLPEIIVECKSTDVNISSSIFSQIGLYNSSLQVKYLIVTNGLVHYVAEMDYENKKYIFLDYIPEYK
jgi:hypothetical protein